MALEDSDLWQVNFTFQDRDRNTSTMQVNFGGGLAYPAVATEAGAIYNALQGISDAEIVQQTITRRFEDTDLLTLAPETSDVERKAVFTFRDADRRAVTISVPSIKNDLVIDGSNTINPADTLISAFVAAVVANGVTSRGDDIIRLDKVRKGHVNSRKG